MRTRRMRKVGCDSNGTFEKQRGRVFKHRENGGSWKASLGEGKSCRLIELALVVVPVKPS